MKRYLLNFLLFGLLTSCGPSAADVASIQNAAQEELLRQQAEAKKQEELKTLLIELKSQLAGEQEKLNNIESFQLLRMPEEKEQQVADQTKVIEMLKLRIEEVEKEINY